MIEQTLEILAPSGVIVHEKVVEPEYVITRTVDLEKRRQEAIARKGRFAWEKLHRYLGCDRQWFELWVYFIPSQCDCREGFQKILEELPPDFSSPEAFFAWGVRLHNLVNAKLGKPQITLEDACRIWRGNPNVQVGEQS
jgi:hypothetical protein